MLLLYFLEFEPLPTPDMSSPARTKGPAAIPMDVTDWLAMVQKEQAISPAVRNGQKPMHIAQTPYQSGSKILQDEFLHLRAVWYIYEGTDVFDVLYRDAKPDPDKPTEPIYRGYVSPQHDDKAAALFAKFSSFWRKYRENLEKNISDLTTDLDCGGWSVVRFLQDMAQRHVKDGKPVSYTPTVYKPGYKPGFDDGDGSGSNASLPGFQSLEISDQNRTNAAERPHDTPQAPSREMAKRSEFNRPSVDEMYANTALLFLLEEIRKEIDGDMTLCNWVIPRLGLHLEAKPAKRSFLKSQSGILMQAQVDGYLCRRTEDYEFVKFPLAICETKPCVRTERWDAILRQETAEMACWIAEHGKQREGLLRASASGRSRRLLISQDRHEIYIIIGEYGPTYQEYIAGNIALPAKAPPAPADFDAEQNQRAAQGSGSYNKQAEDTGADQIRLSRKGPTSKGKTAKAPESGQPSSRKEAKAKAQVPAQQPGEGRVLRSQTPPPPRRLPPADEFLVMHQFGPYVTGDARHMELFVRRVIGLMLELYENSK